MNYASWNKRIVSYLIDVGFVYLAVYFLLSIFNINWTVRNLIVSAGLFSMIYFPIALRISQGKTFGAVFLKIRVVFDENVKITLWKSFVRSTVLILSLAPIPLFMMIAIFYVIQSFYLGRKSPYKEKRQTAWDIYTKTCVIET